MDWYKLYVCPTAHAVTKWTDVVCLLQIDMCNNYKQAYKKCWLQYQQEGRGLLSDAVVAAQAIPYSFVQLLDSSSVVAMSLAQVRRLCRKLPQSPQPAQHASICTNSARKDVGHGC